MTAYVLLCCKTVIVAVLIAALMGKRPGQAFAAFRDATGRLLPPRLERWQQPGASAVFAAEALAASTIPYPRTAVAGLVLATMLFLGFTIAITFALRRGETDSCNCFGTSTAPLGVAHLVRNALLVIVATFGMVLSSRLVRVEGTTTEAGPTAVAVIGGLCTAVLLSRLDDILDLFRPSPVRTVTKGGP